jgi:galactokinase/mevalonate kinase-like predicted kinase
MAELTNLEEKLAEVTGLAMAARAATTTVSKLAEEDDRSLVDTLQAMNREAAEVEERCTTVAANFKGKKTAILEEAREVKKKASEMMDTYLDEKADALDGFEFLTMAEAAEVGHWGVLQAMNEQASNSEVGKLVEWALPMQERHFRTVLEGSRKLAAEEDPNETAA